ncbi:MAG: type I methionyl aminopeptidase [Candidatus Melainabacteria bacterium]|nr:type I methionyl aminopeptidase [Candidatus Melainabacteria bacterium]
MALFSQKTPTIPKKSRHEINTMRAAGRILAETHRVVAQAIQPGVTPYELDQIAEAYIRQQGGSPTFKGYHGFPATLCTSINDEVVHGIPRKDRVLKDGDVISVDCGVNYRGWNADCAITHPVGIITPEVQQLLTATRESLYAAIAMMREGNYLEDVSGAIEDVCAKYQYGLVKNYGGHGIGQNLHEEPFVHNYRTGNRGPILRAGNTLAIEPMFNLGSAEVYTDSDEWTVITVDHLPSAHFEHTVLVTEGEPEILTVLPEESP